MCWTWTNNVCIKDKKGGKRPNPEKKQDNEVSVLL
jgi:hypothetical protein